MNLHHLIEDLADRAAGLLGRKLVPRDQPEPAPPPAPPPELPLWDVDEEFQRVVVPTRGRTVPSDDRLYMIFQYARYARALDGDLAEVGVYRGGTAKLIGLSCPGRPLHLFDTFTGMPHHEAGVDIHKEGEFADTSLEQVRVFLADVPGARFYPGLFPETAAPVRGRRFALVHADADQYQSTRDCLAFFYDRLVPGGVLLFDDYEWNACPGVRRAIDEFLAARPGAPPAIVTTRYQCVLIKSGG